MKILEKLIAFFIIGTTGTVISTLVYIGDKDFDPKIANIGLMLIFIFVILTAITELIIWIKKQLH